MVRFLTTLAIAATTVAVPAERTTPSAISVGVFAPPDVPESLVIRIFDEARAIWGPAGVAFDWHRITSNDVAAAWQVTVTIDDERTGCAEPHGALGWIPFTADGPAPAIRLSRANAEALIRPTSGVRGATIAGHEILIGRALGRALSHEIGHYLLKSKVHTPHGLMRAIWPADEVLANDRRGFELTAEQRAAVEHIQQGGLDQGQAVSGRAGSTGTPIVARAGRTFGTDPTDARSGAGHCCCIPGLQEECFYA